MVASLFDTHAHLISDDWDKYPARALTPGLPTPDRPNYTVTVESLIEMMDSHNVERACLVQRGHVYGFDNSYIIDSAAKFPGRLHPVVILDAQDPETPAKYRHMVKNDSVCGFRMAAARPWLWDTAWMSSPAAMEIWKACADLGTPMTIIFYQKHLSYNLPLLKIIAKQFPDLPIIIDHGGMPYGMTQVEVGYAEEDGEEVIMPPPPDFGINETIKIFEDVPNVYFKFTEINIERLAAEKIRPAHIVRRLVDGFGPDRLVWGSDIGQSMLWSYKEKTEMARKAADFLTEEEAVKFLHDNAARIYSNAC
ncbi:amidohydrolase family protein [Hyphococcus luteus]|uniref:Amidohydrolase n=1 Tax=Hyphococcus luteus TaxID=2058213 RepID=A0A2S7K294_9PROT|nr:amidohydrolase family protein [Marinicaulis flavus]PQA86616.1 amidohydrolase [Marinicaulis flavus]